MGTSNFHIANASKVYVLEDEDIVSWDDYKEDLTESIKYLCKKFEVNDNIESKRELRSYPTSSIGFILGELTYLNISFEIYVNLFIRSGYYEAANLDYEIQYYAGVNELDSIEYMIDDIEEDPNYYCINAGLFTIHQHRLKHKLEDLEESLINEIEDLMAKVTQPYNVVGQFSNGETIYEKEN